MTVLATRQNLADHLHEIVNNGSADVALEFATERVRRYTGQAIDRVSNDVVVISSSGGVVLLPQRPVISVASVEVGGNPVVGWVLDGDELTHASAWLTDGTAVEVTYTHGHDPVPTEVRDIVLTLAGWRYNNPTRSSTEAQDDYRVENAAQQLTAEDLAILDHYRLREVAYEAAAVGGAFTITPGYTVRL